MTKKNDDEAEPEPEPKLKRSATRIMAEKIGIVVSCVVVLCKLLCKRSSDKATPKPVT